MVAVVIDRAAAVHRILDRYLIEVVERFDLCPWARSARINGEVAVGIVWGSAPPLASWIEMARELLARPTTRVAMVVAPELSIEWGELHDLRNEVAAAIAIAGVAEFHPVARLDLATPARLVPFLRRSPDPLLQLVPLALLQSVRGDSPAVDRAQQVQLLNGTAEGPKPDFADQIASANHATVTEHQAAITSVLDAIAADRAATYAAAGIGS